MFGLLSRKRSQPDRDIQRNVQLSLETLETRDCPAAPVITAFTATPTNMGTMVELDGMVGDEHPASVMIMFNGVASGSVVAEANGHFHFSTQASALGTIEAFAVDDEALLSNVAQSTISSNAPNVTFSVNYGDGLTVILTGTVTDEEPGGRLVNFTGKVNDSIVTNPDGTFSLTTQASGLGAVYATTTDAWNQISNTAEVTLTSNAPIISNFQAIEGPGRIWTFQGQILDESAAGLVVRFGGLDSLIGKTAIVEQSGWFYLTIQLQPGERGTVSAITTDWWGLDSNTALTYVD